MRRLLVLFLAVGLFLFLFVGMVTASDQSIIVPGYKIIDSASNEAQEEIEVVNPLDQNVKIEIQITDWKTKINSRGITVRPVMGEDTESKFASSYGFSDYENSLYPYMNLPEKNTYTIPANDKINIQFSTNIPKDIDRDCLWTAMIVRQVEPKGKSRFVKIIEPTDTKPLSIDLDLSRDMDRPFGAYFDVVIKNNSNTDIFYPINAVIYDPDGDIAEVKEGIFTEDITYFTHVPENSNLELKNKKQLIWTLPPAHIPANESIKIKLGLDEKYFKGFKNDWYEFTLQPAFNLKTNWNAETGKFNPQRLIDKY